MAAAGSQTITPFEVHTSTGIDYDHLLRDFGCSPLTPALIARFESLTGEPPHRFLRRGLFFAHRDLEELLDAYERCLKFVNSVSFTLILPKLCVANRYRQFLIHVDESSIPKLPNTCLGMNPSMAPYSKILYHGNFL